MQPGFIGRPLGINPHEMPITHFNYHSAFHHPRVSFYHPPNSQIFIPTYPQSIQAVPFHGYLFQYPPTFVSKPQFYQQYHPQYISSSQFSPHASQNQVQVNPNYQTAKLLTQAKIEQNSIFCVICEKDYKISQKEQHLTKHKRKPDTSTASVDLQYKSMIESIVSNQKQYIIKPLIQPEQHIIPYEPLVYQIIQQVIYEDQNPSINDQEIGSQPIFQQEQNISLDQAKSYKVFNKFIQQTKNQDYQDAKIIQPLVQKNSSINPPLNEPKSPDNVQVNVTEMKVDMIFQSV